MTAPTFPTFTDLIARVILRLSQVPGAGVQTYAEDIVAEALQHGFEILFDEFWWPSHCSWILNTPLDGVTGVVTADLAALGVQRFTDIYGVWFENDEKPLPRISIQTNPNRLGFGGTRPKGIVPINDANKVFQVFPIASTGNVSLYARNRPTTLYVDDPSQEVQIDDQLLILKTCYDYLVDDGNNPGSADKFLAMFESRYDQIQHLLNKGPIALTDETNSIPDQWSELDS